MSTDPLAPAPRSDRSRVNQRLAPQPSQRQAQRTLHDARRACRRHRPEQRIGLVARRFKPRRGVDAGILRVVEGVVSFPAELEVALVTLHVEPLGKRHVPVVDARIPDIVPSGIARVVHAWPGKRRGVEPLVEGVPSGVGVADHIDALAIAAAGFVGTVRGREPDRDRRAGDELGDAGLHGLWHSPRLPAAAPLVLRRGYAPVSGLSADRTLPGANAGWYILGIWLAL